MSSPKRISLLAAGISACSLTLAGCGSTGISAPPLEASISETFTNLYILQQVETGNAKPSPASLSTTAKCRKGSATSAQQGAGPDWVCNITYRLPSFASSVTAGYAVNMQTDGCYAADSDGPSSVNTPLGPQQVGEDARTITDVHLRQIPNPLWLMDGCIDIT